MTLTPGSTVCSSVFPDSELICVYCSPGYCISNNKRFINIYHRGDNDRCINTYKMITPPTYGVKCPLQYFHHRTMIVQGRNGGSG